MTVRIVQKNSTVEDKRPTGSQLANGEIAVNLNSAGAFLTVKDTDGNIQQVGGVKVANSSPGNPVLGTFWCEPSNSRLYIYDGTQWLLVTGSGGGGGGGGGGVVDQVIAGDGLTGGGSSTVVTLNVGEGHGIEITADKIAVKPKTDSGIAVDAGGVAVLEGDGINLGSGGVSVDAGDGIKVDSGGVGVDLEGTANTVGLELTATDGSGKLKAKVATATSLGVVKQGTNITIDADGTINAAGGGGGGGVVNQVTAGDGLTGGGSAADVTLNVGAGNGVVVSADAISVDAHNGILVNANGVSVQPKPNSGISVGSQGVNVVAGNGIATDANGVNVDLDSTAATVGLEFNSGKLQVKPATASALGSVKQGNNITIDADGTINAQTTSSGGVVNNVTAGAGLTGGGSAATVNLDVGEGNGIVVTDDAIAVKPNDGIIVDANGVRVDGHNGIAVDAAGVSVDCVSNGGLEATASGVSVKAGDALKTDASGLHVDLTADANRVGLEIASDKLQGKIATGTSLGMIKVGSTLTIDSSTGELNGTIASALTYKGNLNVTDLDGGPDSEPASPQAGDTYTVSKQGTIDAAWADLLRDPQPSIANVGDMIVCNTTGGGTDHWTLVPTGGGFAGNTYEISAVDSSGVKLRLSGVTPATTDDVQFAAGSGISIARTNDSTITITNSSPGTGSPGDGALTIKLAGQSGDNQSGSFTADQDAGSTITLPAIDYNQLTNKPTIPPAVTPGDGSLTIKLSGQTSDNQTGSFTADQAGNTTITLPAVKYANISGTPSIPAAANNGALEIKTAGEGAVATGTFTADIASKGTLTLPTIRYQDISGTPTIPSAPGDGSLTIKLNGQSGAAQTGTFTADQAGDTTITLPQIDYTKLSNLPTIPAAQIQSDWNQSNSSAVDFIQNKPTIPVVPTIGDGKLSISTAGEGSVATNTFKANQTGDTTIQLPTIRYQDLSGKPTIPAAANNGALTIKLNGQSGDSQTGTFTADQAAGSTITLPAINYANLTNKPTIPAAQVNSDWNATGGVAEILNKPVIPDVSGFVTLDTTQTISGSKTFSTSTVIQNLTLDTSTITSGNALSLKAGGTNAVEVTTYHTNGLFRINKADTGFSADLKVKDLTAARSFNFPDDTGTFALTKNLPTQYWKTTNSDNRLAPDGDWMIYAEGSSFIGSSQTAVDGTGLDYKFGNVVIVDSAIAIVNPTSANANISGLFYLTAQPVSWGNKYKWPNGTAPTLSAFPAVIPFYTPGNGIVVMGSPVEGIVI